MKEDLGPALAKGLAAVTIARPQNPTEYLALWLLHYQQQRERKALEIQRLKALEAEREEWAKGRVVREKQATTVIQREWRAHVKAQAELEREEAALREQFAAVEQTADEVPPEEAEEQLAYGSAAGDAEMTEEEAEAEAERLAYFGTFKRGKLFVDILERQHVAAIKVAVTRAAGKASSSNADANGAAVVVSGAERVLRCCLYMMGYKASKVNTLDKMKAIVKPYHFVQWLKVFDPFGNGVTAPVNQRNVTIEPVESADGANNGAAALPGFVGAGPNAPMNKKNFRRVKRLLGKVDEDDIKACSAALHAVFTWLRAAVLYRHYRDEQIKIRRAAGKECGEDEVEEIPDDLNDDEAEPQAADDLDDEEEVIKASELEERKRAEAERLAEEAENEEHEEES